MDEWEYLPTYIEADASKKEIRNFLKSTFPDLKKPAKYMPESMMPKLNELGSQGWELVHMQPVRAVGKKRDVLFESFGRRWSKVYFCVFKRRKTAEAASVQSQRASEIVYAPIPAEQTSYIPLPQEAGEGQGVLPHEPLQPALD